MISIIDLVEVTLGEKDDFLKVRETLTRIGVASKNNLQMLPWKNNLNKRIFHKNNKDKK